MGRVRDGMSDSFRLLNRNKRPCGSTEAGARRDAFLRLARRADVVVESFQTRVVARLGVGYDAVSALNPRIVYCSISGYGQDGPYAQRADTTSTTSATRHRRPDRDARRPGRSRTSRSPTAGERWSPRWAFSRRSWTRARRRGRYVDASMTDAALAHACSAAGLLERGKSPARGTGMLDAAYPLQRLSTKDGISAVGLWSASSVEPVRRIGAPDLKGQALVYAPTPSRQGGCTRLRYTHPKTGSKLSPAPTAASAGAHHRRGARDEQLRARKMIVDGGEFAQFRAPAEFSEFEFKIEQNAPAPGEHTGEILREPVSATRDRGDAQRRSDLRWTSQDLWLLAAALFSSGAFGQGLVKELDTPYVPTPQVVVDRMLDMARSIRETVIDLARATGAS